MRTSFLFFPLLTFSLLAAENDGKPYNLPLWPTGQVPMAKGDGPLDAPFLTVFRPPAGKANGTAVVIAPGGSNIMLMYGCEGIEIAERLNDWGVTAFVLTYRMAPRYDDAARALDGNRALRLVRHRAKEFGIDPAKVGFAGFSAGSTMARYTTNAATAGDASAADPVDRLPSRADFLVMVYGPGRPAPGEDLAKFPPTFLLSAAHDRGAANGSAQLFLDLNKAGAVVEMHLYQKGRHGFGSAYTSPEYGPWMDELKHFLVQAKFLPGAPAPKAAPVAAPNPQSFRSVNDGHGDYMFVPAGAFTMGDTHGDGEAREGPAHVVELDAYYMKKTEVTNAEWRQFREDPGYNDPKFWPGGRVMPKEQIPYWTMANNHGGALGNDNYPVLGVNWDAAVAYCNWLSAKTGKKYRLPTEAEWEKAARGTDKRRFPWGNVIDHSYANFVGSQAYDTGRPVAYYDGTVRDGKQTNNGASPYGIHDMAGSVMEWCADWYDKDYYKVSPRKNPKGPATGAYRVVRGGTFFMEPQDQRVYLRAAAWPSVQTHRMTGFRPVREP